MPQNKNQNVLISLLLLIVFILAIHVFTNNEPDSKSSTNTVVGGSCGENFLQEKEESKEDKIREQKKWKDKRDKDIQSKYHDQVEHDKKRQKIIEEKKANQMKKHTDNAKYETTMKNASTSVKTSVLSPINDSNSHQYGEFQKGNGNDEDDDESILDSSKLLPKKLNLWEEKHGISTNHKEMPKYHERAEIQLAAVSKLANKQLRPDIPIQKSKEYEWNNSTIQEEDNAIGLNTNL